MPDCKEKEAYRPKPGLKPIITGQRIENGKKMVDILYQRCHHSVTIDLDDKTRKSRTVDGYIVMNTPNGYMGEHRYVWELAHGKLEKGWVVHHINGIKDDNRLENLIALPRHSHNRGMKEEQPSKLVCPHCNTTLSIIRRRSHEYIAI